ncbi:Hypothetical protein R9X50_00571100 [Acrodontium crateriforme]|uniref:Geranylgeranyl pyrophosphate synthetase n=1 Tax=Acrodontium crateriforme TaxID=150365 RepID=A0AAQ3M9V3_9PEZI|nr:Hypothetical protein R9X50_00571100 [Acrodontium crateriforme]
MDSGFKSGFQSRGGTNRGYPNRMPNMRTLYPPLPPPLGPRLQSIKSKSIQTDMCDLMDAKITQRQYVASYNLMAYPSMEILVPGCPPLWTPPREASQLEPDKGSYYRDENAARFPEHPFHPAIKSMFHQEPCFDTTSVDVFACASTLGNLLRFVSGEHRPFSMVVETVGRSAFFLRREESPAALIDGIQGYGHAFPEAYTTWEHDVKGSMSSQRIIRYKFGGLDFLLRFEADGYIGSHRPACPVTRDASAVDDLIKALKVDTAIPMMRVSQAGKVVSQEDLFDLKTRTSKRKNDDIIGQELPRLWARQVSQLVLAFHTSGKFDEIRIENIRERMLEWETNRATELRKCAVLVKDIVAAVKETSDGMMEVRCTEAGILELRAVPANKVKALPDELKQLWINRPPKSSDHDIGKDEKTGYHDSDDDDEVALDYTACTAEDCGYCGHCSY